MAAEAVGCSRRTAIDNYSMTREVAEVVMSNEVKSLIINLTSPIHCKLTQMTGEPVRCGVKRQRNMQTAMSGICADLMSKTEQDMASGTSNDK